MSSAFDFFGRLDDDFDYNYDYKDLEDFVLLTATSVYDIQVWRRRESFSHIGAIMHSRCIFML